MNDSIRLVIDFTRDSSGEVGIHVTTEAFDVRQTPDDLGSVWVGFCKAINAHMRARGSPDFNCLEVHEGN